MKEKKPFDIRIQIHDSQEYKFHNCTNDFIAGFLLVLIDEQGLELEKSYTIYKNKGKPLSTKKILKILTPYIIEWHPITKEKELTFTNSSLLKHRGVYKRGDIIQIQCNEQEDFSQGVYDAIEILQLDDQDFLKWDGKYVPEYKSFKLTERKRKHMQKYTAVCSSRRRSVITPRKKKPLYSLGNLKIMGEDGTITCASSTDRKYKAQKFKYNSNKNDNEYKFILKPNYAKEKPS